MLELDRMLCQHPQFDPADPEVLFARLYRWADRRVEERFQSALKDTSLRRLVIDGTGTHAKRQMRRMAEAREAGWFVKVLYVNIPLDTSVPRAAARARPVGADRIYYYQAKIFSSLVQVPFE